MVRRKIPISIHAPLAGRDNISYFHTKASIRFQSTRPLRGATALIAALVLLYNISIHAPLAGRDGQGPGLRH